MGSQLEIENIDETFEKIQTFKNQFGSILDEYKDAYVNYKVHPDIPEYKARFDAFDTLLNNVNKEVFIVTNEIDAKTNQLNAQIVKLNENIERERSLNGKLLFYKQQASGLGDGSSVMIDNTTELYKSQYISNINIFLGILLLAVGLYKVFGMPAIKPPVQVHV